MLKQRLLNTGLFVDNEYLDKCILLIEEGLSVGYIKYKTHKHHIIPRAYYRYNNLPVDDSDNNIVYLLFKNHVLIHYYMSLCAYNDEFRYINELSFYYLNNKKYFSIEESELLKQLPEYQRLYEEMCKTRGEKNRGRKFTKEQKKRCSEAQKQRFKTHPRTKETIERMIQSHRKNDSYKHSQERKDLQRDAILGRKHMINNELHQEKLVLPEDINDFLNRGWVFGTFHKGFSCSEESNQKKSLSLRGKSKSTQHKESLSRCKKGLIAIHNDDEFKFVKPSEVDDYILNGWEVGNGRDYSFLSHDSERSRKISEANSGRKWMNNGVISKMVKEHEVDIFIKDGFVLGRLYER